MQNTHTWNGDKSRSQVAEHYPHHNDVTCIKTPALAEVIPNKGCRLAVPCAQHQEEQEFITPLEPRRCQDCNFSQAGNLF